MRGFSNRNFILEINISKNISLFSLEFLISNPFGKEFDPPDTVLGRFPLYLIFRKSHSLYSLRSKSSGIYILQKLQDELGFFATFLSVLEPRTVANQVPFEKSEFWMPQKIPQFILKFFAEPLGIRFLLKSSKSQGHEIKSPTRLESDF